MTKSDFYLRGDPVSLVISNVPSIQGGRSNPWMDAGKNVMGVRNQEGEGLKPDDLEDTFKEQSVSDGLLEMTIIPNMVGLASGTARRIGQAEGPFEIKFRDIGDDDEETIAFIQIDGEFFRCRNLLSITFSLNPKLEDGSVWAKYRNVDPRLRHESTKSARA